MKFVLKANSKLRYFNILFFYRKRIKTDNKIHNPKQLNKNEKGKIKKFFSDRGYHNINTSWHRFYISSTNFFSEKFIPGDIFHSIISEKLNQKQKWPALLDKNLYETLFKGFKQPVSVVKNINGFFYVNDKQVTKIEALEECCKQKDKLVIKPSIDSGRGRNVVGFTIQDKKVSHNNLPLENLFDSYKKDFIIQKVVKQHPILKSLNESSLNTLRIMTYLKEKEVHILSFIVRIGAVGKFTDNHASGRVVCGVNENGSLKEYGYLISGKRKTTTDSNTRLEGVVIPGYYEAVEMVKEMHFIIPYFKIVSWDIGIDDKGAPVFIEYNTYRQGINSQQLANGPLFGDFTDELLELGRK